MLNLSPAIWEAIAGTGRGKGIEVFVLTWERLHLNPHPFKNKRVRHPKAELESASPLDGNNGAR
jgi:hypothetical protein